MVPGTYPVCLRATVTATLLSYVPPSSDGPAAHEPWGAILWPKKSLYVYELYSLTLRTGSVSEILGMSSLKPTRYNQNGLGCACHMEQDFNSYSAAAKPSEPG